MNNQHPYQPRSKMISEDAAIQTFKMQHGGGYTTYSVETLDGRASFASLEVIMYYGGGAKLSVGTGTHEWLVAPSSAHLSTREKQRWLTRITGFVCQLLAALEGVAWALRQTEFPARALGDLAPEELAEIRAELSKAFSASPEVRAIFGECLLEMARLFPDAREILREGRAEAARDKRLTCWSRRTTRGPYLDLIRVGRRSADRML